MTQQHRPAGNRSPHRARNWLIALGVIDLLAWILTLRAHFEYHRAKNGPTVMSIGQLLGWIVSVILLVLIAVILVETRRSHRR